MCGLGRGSRSKWTREKPSGSTAQVPPSEHPLAGVGEDAAPVCNCLPTRTPLRCPTAYQPRRGPTMRAEATRISVFTALAAHALCFTGLAAAYFLAGRGALVSDPERALRLLVVSEAPIVIGVFSYLRRDPNRCSFFKAAARGLLGLPVGAFLNAFGAIVLGAPVGIKFWIATTYWSLLMSLFTFVPAACVYGASKFDWQNMLSHTIYFVPADVADYLISAPCHGAVLGAWLGAWPMPLDWERPWQEWPISVAYGAVAGHLVGKVASLVLIVLHKRRVRAKAD